MTFHHLQTEQLPRHSRVPRLSGIDKQVCVSPWTERLGYKTTGLILRVTIGKVVIFSFPTKSIYAFKQMNLLQFAKGKLHYVQLGKD